MCLPFLAAAPAISALGVGATAATASVGTTIALATAASAAPGFFASLAIPALTTGQSFIGSLLFSGVSQLFSLVTGSRNAQAQQNFANQRAEAVRLAANAAFISPWLVRKVIPGAGGFQRKDAKAQRRKGR